MTRNRSVNWIEYWILYRLLFEFSTQRET